MFRSNGCRSGKVHYVREQDAWLAAAKVIELGKLEDLKIYDCPWCRAIHLKTATIQLHDWIWRPEWQWRKGVRLWFKARGTIDQWDNE